MHYPFWYVPWLTSPMLIAVMATLHVFVAMFAVGGGMVMALGVRSAYHRNDAALLDYYRQFAWFFILITVVYGAITGVGTWWVIALASPLATEELIHVFVFVWGMEYAAFLTEIVSAFVFFYGWHRLDPRSHQAVGWIYAGSAWISLVLITGITAFMLNTGNWALSSGVWRAFWSPQAVPQVITRTGASLMLAALFIFLHVAFKEPTDADLRRRVERGTALGAILGGLLIIIGGFAWFRYAPPSAQAALVGAAGLNVLMVLLFGLTAITIVMMYVGPYRHPGWITPGFSILFFAMGFAATASGEFVREAVRKPYIIYGHILGNGIRASEVTRYRSQGLLNTGIWAHAYVADRYPDLLDAQGQVQQSKLFALPPPRQREIGRVLFMYHCGDCHSVNGYSAVSQLTRGWTSYAIAGVVIAPDQISYYMPPWCGTPGEAQIAADYVTSVSRRYPPGLVQANGEKSR